MPRRQLPAVTEAILPTHEEFIDSLKPVPVSEVAENNRRCAHCWKYYGEADPGYDNAEVPVKFHCGHTFGEHCMKELFAPPKAVKLDLVAMKFTPGSRAVELATRIDAYVTQQASQDVNVSKALHKLAEEVANPRLNINQLTALVGSHWAYPFQHVTSPYVKVVNLTFLENGLILDVDIDTSNAYILSMHMPPVEVANTPSDALLALASAVSSETDDGNESNISSLEASNANPQMATTGSELFSNALFDAFGNGAAASTDYDTLTELEPKIAIPKSPPESQVKQNDVWGLKVKPKQQKPAKKAKPAKPSPDKPAKKHPLSKLADKAKAIKGSMTGTKSTPHAPEKSPALQKPATKSGTAAALEKSDSLSPTSSLGTPPLLDTTPFPAFSPYASYSAPFPSSLSHTNSLDEAQRRKAAEETKKRQEEDMKKRLVQKAEVLAQAFEGVYKAWQTHRGAVEEPRSPSSSPPSKKQKSVHDYSALVMSVVAQLHKPDTTAKYYEVSQPSGYGNYGMDYDSDDEGSIDDEYNDYQAPILSARTIVLTRRLCGSCFKTKDEREQARTELPGAPQSIGWKDARNARDSCLLCKKRLFRRQPTHQLSTKGCVAGTSKWSASY